MKILLLSYTDYGGAARATIKIHNALTSLGHTASILVDIKKTNSLTNSVLLNAGGRGGRRPTGSGAVKWESSIPSTLS